MVTTGALALMMGPRLRSMLSSRATMAADPSDAARATCNRAMSGSDSLIARCSAAELARSAPSESMRAASSAREVR